MDILDAKCDIELQLKGKRGLRGTYSHNIISLILRQVAKEHGRDATNKLVEECGLEARGWRKEGAAPTV